MVVTERLTDEQTTAFRRDGFVRLGGFADDLDGFSSRFILEKPGAWGQPWHQDSSDDWIPVRRAEGRP
jgi:hypothetical protein